MHQQSFCPQRDLDVNLTLVVSCRVTAGCLLTRGSFTGLKISRCSNASLQATKHLTLSPHACPGTSTRYHAVSEQHLDVKPDPVQLLCNIICRLGEYMFLKCFLVRLSHVSHHHPITQNFCYFQYSRGKSWSSSVALSSLKFFRVSLFNWSYFALKSLIALKL